MFRVFRISTQQNHHPTRDHVSRLLNGSYVVVVTAK